MRTAASIAMDEARVLGDGPRIFVRPDQRDLPFA